MVLFGRYVKISAVLERKKSFSYFTTFSRDNKFVSSNNNYYNIIICVQRYEQNLEIFRRIIIIIEINCYLLLRIYTNLFI